MTSKDKTFREKENEKERGKKRYRERLIEEAEAEQQIREYDRSDTIPLKEEHPYNHNK